MNRFYILALLLFSTVSVAREVDLLASQAIVIAGVGSHSFTFEEISTGETFTIKGGMKYKYKPTIVTAGKYYLKSIDLIFTSFEELNYDKPEDDELFFNIGAGNATYIGDWLIDTEVREVGKANWEIERDFSYKYLKKVSKRNGYLTRYPLTIANEQGKAISISWKEI
jgi:hypothetical protein